LQRGVIGLAFVALLRISEILKITIMKIKLIFLCLLLSGLSLKSQESKYFDIHKRPDFRITRFTAKGMTFPPSDVLSAQDDFRYNQEYVNKTIEYFKRVFGKPDSTEMAILKEVQYCFFYNSTYKVVYFLFYYPTKALDQYSKWDEKFYQFGEIFVKEFDLKSQSRHNSPESFTRGEFWLQFSAMFSYMKDSKRKMVEH
jgi:hypothetical protein